MDPYSGNTSQRKTRKITDKHRRGLSWPDPALAYRPIPHGDTAESGGTRPVWRVRFELASDPSVAFGLDINDEIMLGRGPDAPDCVDLSAYDAEMLGVSRLHLMLRPTATNLFVLDLGSTNGTWQNDRSIGVNTPYSLVNGDILSLGGLRFIVRIVKRPPTQTGLLREQANLADALTEIAKAITSQPALDEVLAQVLSIAMALTSAREATIWLVDEQSGELVLEAERGIEDDQIRRLRLPVKDTLAGKVIRTGKSLRTSRTPDGKQVKVKTGYLVEALVYVPLTLGGVTFGVLAAAHREPGKAFTAHDKRLLETIGDFAAIAVQNSRLYRATDETLAGRVEELTVLNELARAVSASLDLEKVHDAFMQQIYENWEVKTATVWLVDDDTQTAVPFLASGEQQDGPTHPLIAIGEGAVGKVMESGEPHIVDGSAGYRSVSVEDTQRIQSQVVVPIKLKGNVIGVLDIQGSRSAGFSETDVLLLQAVTDHLATAIENARLFDELKKAYESVAEADRLKTEMIQNISHEFRTPLSYMVGYVGMLLDETPTGMGPLTEEQRKSLIVIEDQTIKLTQMVDHFVTLERTKGVALHKMATDIGALLETAVESARLPATEAGVTLTLEVAAGLPWAKIDRMAISQVLDNLISNALKFTPPQGKVEVLAWLDPADERIYLSVADTGIGIPEELGERIFERFYQVDGTMTRQFGGMGLGLALCKEIVEAHGERIWVESTPEHGATFTFTLPPAPDDPERNT